MSTDNCDLYKTDKLINIGVISPKDSCAENTILGIFQRENNDNTLT